ncbi:MAG: DinB family protein [Streptosporangiaceae bacterium]
MADFANESVSRMRAAAARVREMTPAFAGHQTSPDPGTGEQWDQGQVLSHVAEMLPYWTGEVRKVVDGGGRETPFGRVKTTPSRIDRIEAGRREDPAALLDRIDAEMDAAARELQGLTAEQWELTGRHEKKGVMTVKELAREFLVDHIEEHVTQMSEQLSRG